jgi:hypothetical protein
MAAGLTSTDAAEAVPGTPEASCQWPIDLTRYDRSPQLTTHESRALARIGDGVRAWPRLDPQQPAWGL